jgi:branched-chain amino acid transport system substrate-binding protein
MRIDRKGFLAGAAATAVSAVPATARAQFRNPYATQLTIAVNAPTSGDAQNAGLQIAYGVQGAVDEANLYGGTLTTVFAMRTFDDRDALAQSMVNVQFAASDSTILATIGGTDGSLLDAALQTYASQQMPLIVAASTWDAITSHGYRNVWRLPTKDSVEGQLHARFVAARLKPKTAIAVTQDGDYGPIAAHGFVDQAKSSGIDADGFQFPYDKPDYATAAARIVQKKPDYIVLCGTTEAMGPLIPALRAAGFAGTLGATEGFYNQSTLQKYADAFATGFISTSFPPLELAPDVANALTDFRARYPVTALSAFAYAAAQVVISAARRTGARDRLSLMSALQAPATYRTMVGDFQFDFNGDPIDPNAYFYRIDKGKFKFVAPAHPTAFVL